MIVMQCGAHLPKLGIASGFQVVLPDSACVSGERMPLVVCLHEDAQDGEHMLHTLCLNALVEECRVALLLPDGQNSCFLDMVHGPHWETYLMEDLIPFAQRTFPLGNRLYLLGMGTGGWAAARLAGRYGDRFAGSLAIDAIPDFQQAYAEGRLSMMPDLEAALGDPAGMPDYPLSPDTLWFKDRHHAVQTLRERLNADGSATA